MYPKKVLDLSYLCCCCLSLLPRLFSLQKNSHNVRTRRLEFVRQTTMIWSTNCDFSQVLESSCPSASPHPSHKCVRPIVTELQLAPKLVWGRGGYRARGGNSSRIATSHSEGGNLLREGIVLLPTSKFQDRSPASASLEERGCLSSGAEDLISPKAKRRAD